MLDIQDLATTVREAAGLQGKRDLEILARLPGARDGDDAAVLPHGEAFLLLCGEAIAANLLAADPYAAGVAAVVTNISDIRAMGGRPLGLVDMVVSPDRAHAEAVLDGIGWAAGLLGVDVVGGHLTIGHDPSLSAACTGVARRPLRARDARAGDRILAAFSLEGEYRGDTPIFSSLRHRAPARLQDDGEALVEVAERESCHAARDVSMPGTAGSLLQLLECNRLGATLEVDAVPRPEGISPERWLLSFPSFGFVLLSPPDRVGEAAEPFRRRGLACAECGTVDDSGVMRLATGDRSAVVWDLTREPLTTLSRE
jgi:selenophosphate synthetase-related protein